MTELGELYLRAAVYRLLALGFSYPEPSVLAKVRSLAAELADSRRDSDSELREPLREVLQAVDGSEAAELGAGYNDLFARNVAIAPYETAYLKQGFAKPREMADIAGFYRAFGLESAGEHRELPDFVGSELEFMAIVLTRWANVAGQGFEEKARVCFEAQEQFLTDHLGRWFPTFCRDIIRQSGEGLYGALARLGQAFIRGEICRLAVQPELLEARTADEAGEQPMDCDPKVTHHIHS